MYELTIVTEYNTIHLVVEDYNSPEVKEILEQPYIKSVEWHLIKNKSKVRRKEDEMARNRKNET
jgi:predicted metal-binding protein